MVDKSLDELAVWTADNLEGRRTQLKKRVEEPDNPRREQLLSSWLDAVLSPVSPRGTIYRIQGADIDADLAWAAKMCRANEAVYFGPEAVYRMRLIWRALLRNYAWLKACKVAIELARLEAGAASAFGHLLRLLSLLYPKMLFATIIGAMAILSSSGLQSCLFIWGPPPQSIRMSCLFAAGSFLLCFSEVARRVGRRWRDVLLRCLGLFTSGAAWSSCLALAGLPISPSTCAEKHPTPPWFLVAAAILLIALLTQLFWHDHPISEPL